MGISNLLQFLKPISSEGHVKQCEGKVVGVDAMCWMHRGAVASAVDLVEGRETDRFLRYIIDMISLMQFYNVTPMLVFDGDRVAAKSGEDEKRRVLREKARREALELIALRNAKHHVDYKELTSKCTRSISITPAMICNDAKETLRTAMVDKVIAACRELGVRCIVAPFEADAQLGYLSQTNQIYGAISEDSDLLAYGCKRVMFKMDKDGKCEILELPSFGDTSAARIHSGPKTSKQLELLRILKSFTHERFIAMCVLSGCDYTTHVHINGMGVATACKLVSQLGTLKRVLDFLCRDRKWSERFPLPKEEVIQGHLDAEKAFTHHRVFDPQTQRVVAFHTHSSQESEVQINFENTDERAIQVAEGILDPRTGTPRNTQLSPVERELIKEFQNAAMRRVGHRDFAKRSATKAAGMQAAKDASQSTEWHVRVKLLPSVKDCDANGFGTMVTTNEAPPSQVPKDAACPLLMKEGSTSTDGDDDDMRSENGQGNSGFSKEFHLAKRRLQEEDVLDIASCHQHKVARISSMQDEPTKRTPACLLKSTGLSKKDYRHDVTFVESKSTLSSEALPSYVEFPVRKSKMATEFSESLDVNMLQGQELSKYSFKADIGTGSIKEKSRSDLVIKTRFAHRTKLLAARSKPRAFPNICAAGRSVLDQRVAKQTTETNHFEEKSRESTNCGFVAVEEADASSKFLDFLPFGHIKR